MERLHCFLSSAEDDPRITTAHISVYVSLWKKWKDSGSDGPLSFFRTELAAMCKISSCNTFHKVIRQLHEYGYITYVPSYNHFSGSQVYFITNEKVKS
jgi:hypothetical protein